MTAIKIKQDGAWVRVPSIGVETFPDAPKDGVQYARKDGDWSKVEATGGSLDLSPLFTEEGPPVTSTTQEYLDTIKAAYDKHITSCHYQMYTIPLLIAVAPELVSISFNINAADKTGISCSQLTFTISVSDLHVESDEKYIQLLNSGDGTRALMNDGTYKEIKVDLYETLKITLNGNQPQPDESLNGAIIYVKYNKISIPLTWEGIELTAKLPLGVFYSFEPERVNGYSLPAKQNYTATPGDARSVLLYYNTQITTVAVETDDGASVAGQTLTITNTADDSVIYTGVAGTSIFKVPIGVIFKMHLDNKEGYLPAQDLTSQALSANTRYRITYVKIKSSTIIFEKIADPSNITGDVNTGHIAQILSKWRRCLCKKTADGKVTISYLKNDDSNFYEDGSASLLTGNNGDVMVYKPEFYYKYEKISDTKFSYKLSENYIDETYIHSPASLIGAYKAQLISNKLYSRSRATPMVNNDIATFDIQAKARGAGYQLIDYEQHCMIALMLYAKYGNRNLQAVLGAGGATYTPATATGTTNQKGNNDTVNETSGYVNGLGIEGVFGGFYEWVSGVAIQDRVWTITNQDGTTRTSNAHSADGWITNVAAEAGPHFDMIPTGVGGSETTHYSDYYHQSDVTRVLARSCSSSATFGGVAYTGANYTSSSDIVNVGSRLAFRGEITEESNVEAFKALPIIN